MISHNTLQYECWAYVCRTLKHLIWLSRVTLEKRVNYFNITFSVSAQFVKKSHKMGATHHDIGKGQSAAK